MVELYLDLVGLVPKPAVFSLYQIRFHEDDGREKESVGISPVSV